MRDLTDPPLRPCLLTRVAEGEATSDGPLWLVLHDRHEDIAGARALARRHLALDTPRLLIRSARMQTRGSLAPPKGPFWFIGPLEKPELSTLGDGLEQLERLLHEIPRHQVALLAKGEGAVVALCLALLCPTRIAALHLVGAALPVNLARMPLALPCPAPLQITIDHTQLGDPLYRIFPNATITVAGP